MNVVIINKSDSTGGAAVVSFRLMNALREQGIDASMLVTEKLTDSPFVHLAAPAWRSKIPFLAERLRIFLTKGVDRSNLFKVDTGRCGLPLHRHPLVRNADIVCLNWVNQGMLSLAGLNKIRQLGKPVVWTMHDMWCFTGICHHAGRCRRFEQQCGQCHLLGSGGRLDDISHKTLIRKLNSYGPQFPPVHFVAVSNWLAELARKSTLLRDMPLSVIGNAFPLADAEAPLSTPNHKGTFTILFGAARLDDPVKGLPILIEATRVLKRKYPAQAGRLHLVTFGSVKVAGSLDGMEIPHTHLGPVSGADNLRKIYLAANAVVSTSLYETLPGTLVEGQAYGCIPVAFDRGGQKDIVDHDDTGFLAEWNDDPAIAAENIAEAVMMSFKAKRELMIPKMQDAVRRKFDYPVIARKYIALFRSLIG